MSSFPPSPQAVARLERERERQTRQRPSTALSARLAGWAPLDAATPPTAPERLWLERAGLWPAIASGTLSVSRWVGGQGARSAREVISGAVLLHLCDSRSNLCGLWYLNPGSPEELLARGVQPQGLLGRPTGHAALSTPRVANPACRHELIIDGVLDSLAVTAVLEVMGQSDIALQGLPEPVSMPCVTHDLQGRNVYLPPTQAVTLAPLYHAGGAHVHLMEPFTTQGQPVSMAELLRGAGPDALKEVLEAAMGAARPYQPAAPVDQLYIERDGRIYRLKQSARGPLPPEPLINFSARITREIELVHADGTRTLDYELEGTLSDGTRLRTLRVPARDYGAMRWVTSWGAAAIIYGGLSVRDHAAAAIQSLSAASLHRGTTVYRQTGWVEHEGQLCYLTAGTCVTADGPAPHLQVNLAEYDRLSTYALPVPPRGDAERRAVRASLDLMGTMPHHLSVPQLGMTYLAPLGITRFALWLQGPSGQGKTTLAALCQAHYGAGWSLAHLPASFMGTAYSVLVLSHVAAHSLMVVDDHKPEGSAQQVQQAEGELQRLVHAVGDHAGRTRGTPDGQRVMGGAHPRGALMLSSELSPQRVATAARILLVRMTDDLLQDPARQRQIRAAQQQARAGVYAEATAGYLRWLAEHHRRVFGAAFEESIRAPLEACFPSRVHARIPENVASLAGAWQVFLTYAVHCGAVSPAEAQTSWEQVLAALRHLTQRQNDLVHRRNPVEEGLFMLLELFETGRVYLTDAETGGEPQDPRHWGWRTRTARQVTWVHEGATSRWSRDPSAAHIGYTHRIQGADWILLQRHTAYQQIQGLAQKIGAPLDGEDAFWSRVKQRLQPLGLMLCEPNKTTHRRQIAGQQGRLPLIHLRADFAQHLEGTGHADALPWADDVPFVPVVPSAGPV